MTTVSLQLSDELISFLNNQAAKEGSPSLHELISNHLACWQRRDEARKKLEKEILLGLESPTIRMTDEIWDKMERRIKDLHPELENE